MPPIGTSGDAWAASTQAWAAMAGLVVAIGLGYMQYRLAKDADRRRSKSYMLGAVAAVEQAETVFQRANGLFANHAKVSRSSLEMSPTIHELEAADAVISSFPLQDAPSADTVYLLIGTQRLLRTVSGHLKAFLANPNNTNLSLDLGEQITNSVEAGRLIRAEHRRLFPPTLVDRIGGYLTRARERRAVRQFYDEVRSGNTGEVP